MVRIREIVDQALKAKVIEKLAEWRGAPADSIPEWFELDDADFSDILIAIREDEDGQRSDYDPRM